MPDQPGGAVAVPGEAGVEPEYVFEGEIVGEPDPAAAPAVVVAHPAVQVFQVITVVIRHEHTRAAARHAAYVPAGAVVAVRRWRRRRSLALAMAERAEQGSDRPAATELLKQAEAERKGRHERARGRIDMLGDLLKLLPRLLAAWALLMLAVGVCLAVAHHSPGYVLWPWKALIAVVSDLVAAIVIITWVLAFGIPAAFVVAFWRLGRRGGDLAPQWAHTAGDGDVDLVIDERAVTQALRQLKLKEIGDYLKGGAPLSYLVPCREEGRGTYCEIRLPGGLPAKEIAKEARRERLAASLYRQTKEVYPSTGTDNSVLKLWVADKGALEEGAGPYPLLADGFADVFKGLPLGRILRGDPSRIPVMGRNTMCGGIPEQGKSTAAKVVACGYALDVTTELRIYVPDTNFDFERFAPRAARYVMGAEDEFIEQICGELEDLKDELQTRGQLLIDAEQEEVTRELAHAGIGLHPVFVLLEEAHVAIQHKKWGKDVSGLLCDIVKLDRKRGVHLFLSTQAPTRDSMPRDVTRNCSNGIAFAVGDHVANDALLGQGAYRGGHRATELIPGTDRGIALCKGLSGERSELVQVHRIQGRDGADDITPIVNRSLAELARQGKAVPGTGRSPRAIVSRDLLADLGTVLRSPDRIKVRDALGLLRELAPSWAAYRSLTATGLREQLLAEGVKTVNASGTHYLDPADLRAVIARREACE